MSSDDDTTEPTELDPAMVERVVEFAYGQIADEKMLTIQPLGDGRAAIPGHWRQEAEERAQPYLAALTAAGVPALVAEVERLRQWKAEALPVMAGLQDLGDVLGVGLGELITGEAAAEKARHLLARATSAEQERDRLRADAVEVARALLTERGQVAAEPAAHRILDGLGEQPAPTALVRVEWGVVLDDLGSTDVYDTREEAEAMAVYADGVCEVVRIETWPHTPAVVRSGEQDEGGE